jgi:biopolymer transport protein ExbD
MKLKRQSRFHHEVGTSALNDIMFFLLLFFLIVSTVANPQVMQLLLPRANSSESITKQQVNLSVTADKQYYIGKRAIPFEELEIELGKELKAMNEPTVILRVDRTLDIQSMVDVLEIGMKLRVKIVLQTNTQN